MHSSQISIIYHRCAILLLLSAGGLVHNPRNLVTVLTELLRLLNYLLVERLVTTFRVNAF
jgi:hypothetical protein